MMTAPRRDRECPSTERVRAWRAKNPDRQKANSRRYAEVNKEQITKKTRAWYKKHRQERLVYAWAFRLKKIYGLTAEQYFQMLEMGKGACWICGKSKTTSGRHRRLSVEHDHHTGRVRGLACFPCNFRLIRRWRHPDTLRKIADYLESTFDGRVLEPGADAPSFLGVTPSSIMKRVRSKRSG